MLLTIALTAYIVLKCIQLGLRWQMETKQDMKPTMPNPITEHITNKNEQQEVTKQQQEALSIFSEYLNGGDPK